MYLRGASALRQARENAGRSRAMLVYAAKFVLGTMPQPSQPAEGPVEPGSYSTVINIHNPSPSQSVTFIKKAVLLFSENEAVKEGFEIPQAPSERREAQLEPDYGMQIDGPDIRQVLLSGKVVPAPVFIEGWVVIESPLPLDVVGVYTVRAPDGTVSIAIDRVVATQL
jgi:hypothetical protein